MTGAEKLKRSAAALRWATDQGALSESQAFDVMSLAHMAGYFRDAPDADSTDNTTVRATKAKTMSDLKKKSDPTAIKGKAATLLSGVKVKDTSAGLSTKKFGVKDKSGNPLRWGKSVCETASEREYAEIGVWFKRLMQKQGLPGVMLSEWETSLLREMCEKGGWVGEFGGVSYNGGPSPDDFVPRDIVRKALLDDTTSGGLLLAPVTFDPLIVTIPLLSGELLPEVNLRVATGRRVQSAVVNNLGVSWGTAPGTAVQPFSTSGLVSELATPIYNLTGAIELSNDLLNDSPVNIGQTVVELFGERQKAELDKVIVNGDGVTQPQGFLRASGLTVVGSDNGVGGPPTVSDYEGLLFGIGKAYRTKDWNPCYIGNDTSYRRARGVQVGPGDERRVFGMDHETYQMLNHPYKVQNDLPNGKVAFGCLRKYRLYQNRGVEVSMSREGRALMLANTSLVVMRSRWGGQVEDVNAFALCTDMQS